MNKLQIILAKEKAKEALKKYKTSGIGISRNKSGEYYIKVLVKSPQDIIGAPNQIDGFEIIFEEVGNIKAY